MMNVLHLLLAGFFLKALIDIVFSLEKIIFLLEEIAGQSVEDF